PLSSARARCRGPDGPAILPGRTAPSAAVGVLEVLGPALGSTMGTVRLPNDIAVLAALAGLAIAAPLVLAQTPLVRGDRPFQSGIELTSITATVTDKEGRLITGLDGEAFEIFEDGVKQQITQFTRDRVPIGLGVLLDISDSMFGQRITDARAAVNRFLFELLDSSDEFFVLAFNHAPKTLTG